MELIDILVELPYQIVLLGLVHLLEVALLQLDAFEQFLMLMLQVFLLTLVVFLLGA